MQFKVNSFDIIQKHESIKTFETSNKYLNILYLRMCLYLRNRYYILITIILLFVMHSYVHIQVLNEEYIIFILYHTYIANILYYFQSFLQIYAHIYEYNLHKGMCFMQKTNQICKDCDKNIIISYFHIYFLFEKFFI